MGHDVIVFKALLSKGSCHMMYILGPNGPSVNCASIVLCESLDLCRGQAILTLREVLTKRLSVLRINRR